MAKNSLPTTTARQMAIMYFVHLVINSLALYVANMVFPNNIVLGNATLNMAWAILLSMGTLALVGILVTPLIEYVQEMRGKSFEMMHWMGIYLAVNFVAIWVITRFAEQFGFGISAWWVGLILAAVLDFLQGMGVMLVYSDRK